jgi:hypothetical protein
MKVDGFSNSEESRLNAETDLACYIEGCVITRVSNRCLINTTITLSSRSTLPFKCVIALIPIVLQSLAEENDSTQTVLTAGEYRTERRLPL